MIVFKMLWKLKQKLSNTFQILNKYWRSLFLFEIPIELAASQMELMAK